MWSAVPAAGLLWALATSGSASAQSSETWMKVSDAMLVASADGDFERAIGDLKRLLRTDLEVTDPARAEAIRWLAHTLHQVGRTDEAREVLLDGIRSGACNPGCRELFEAIEIEADSVSRLPTRWTFDNPNHGFFHQWAFQSQGSIRLDAGAAGNIALVWETMVQSRQPDRLVVGFAQMDPAPEIVGFTVTSESLQGLLQVVVDDVHGRQFGSAGVALPIGEPVQVRFLLRELASVDGQPGTLEPAFATRLYVVDRTGKARAGRNVLRIDDFVVR